MMWEPISVIIVTDLPRIAINSVIAVWWLDSSGYDFLQAQISSRHQKHAQRIWSRVHQVSARDHFGAKNNITGCHPLRIIPDYRYRRVPPNIFLCNYCSFWNNLLDLVTYVFSCPQTPDPYMQRRAAISSNLPQELRKIIEYEDAIGLGCFCLYFCYLGNYIWIRKITIVWMVEWSPRYVSN